MALTKEQRANTIFVILGHEDRASAHQMIRDGLRERGELSGSELSATRLVNSNLSSEELKDINNLKAGQVLMLGKTANTIKSIDQKSGAIYLAGTDGKEHIKFADKLGDHVSLYDKQAAPLARGDIIRASATDKDKGIFAGTTYEVTALNRGRAVLADLNSGQTRKLDLTKLTDGLWDYACTITGYSSESASESNALSVFFSWQKNLTTARAFGVVGTRSIHHSTVYTDNVAALKAKLKESLSQDHKSAALEVTDGKIRPSLTPSKTSLKPSNHAHKNGVTKAIEKQSNQKQHIDAKEVSGALAKDVRGVVTRLLGEPNAKLSNGTQLRYGKKGSLVINLSGTNQGTWHNFETGESGDLLSLIKTELQLPFKEALQYGSDLVGGIGNITLPPTRSMPTTSKSSDTPSKTERWANTILDGVKPIQGTLAETYLTKVRGLSKVSGKDLKFHPKVFVGKDENGKSINAPAMVAISRDSEGKPQGLQVTYLGKDGNKLDTDIQKRSLGKLSGNHVTLSGKKGGGMSFVAEGVETGLSVREAIKDAHVIATLGKHNIKNIDPKTLSDTVVLIADNDGKQLKDDKQIMDAASRLSDAGKAVHIVMPESLQSKTDMNDILKEKGTQGVLNTLANRTIAIDQKTVGMPERNNLAGFKRNNDTDMKSATKAYEQNKIAVMHERLAQMDNMRSQTVQKDEVTAPVPDRMIDRQLQMEREL